MFLSLIYKYKIPKIVNKYVTTIINTMYKDELHKHEKQSDSYCSKIITFLVEKVLLCTKCVVEYYLQNHH